MLLHTINKTPFQTNSLEGCLRTAKDGSAILFIEDGVYAVTKGTQATSAIEAASKRMKIYALKPDVDARGISDRVIDGVELVDYTGFVDLAAEHSAVQAWL